MIDSAKYEKLYFVHEEDEPFTEGTSFDDYDDAVEEAKSQTTYSSSHYVYEVTEAFIRRVGATSTELIINFVKD
jgi:hypothetical protein